MKNCIIKQYSEYVKDLWRAKYTYNCTFGLNTRVISKIMEL